MKVVLILLFFSYCSSVEYHNNSNVKGTPEWGPLEINQTVEDMSNSLESYLKSNKKYSPLELEKFQNNTTEHIDTNILSNEISTNLVKRKIPFIDKRYRKEALKEITDGQRGLTSSKSTLEAGNFHSARYKLIGELNDNVNFNDGKKIQYLLITLKLINLETNLVDWQEQKKFIKVSKVEGYGF